MSKLISYFEEHVSKLVSDVVLLAHGHYLDMAEATRAVAYVEDKDVPSLGNYRIVVAASNDAALGDAGVPHVELRYTTPNGNIYAKYVIKADRVGVELNVDPGITVGDFVLMHTELTALVTAFTTAWPAGSVEIDK